MTKGHAPVHRLDLRLRELGQLFNSMDPAPFLERDLDRDAEEYIESWAMEHAAGSRFQITLHLQQLPALPDSGQLITESIHNFFAYKAELARRELRRLLSQGRTSLAIGLCFLAACLAAANAIGRTGDGDLTAIGREGFIIIGWVAMWRPVEIFLYDWWPLLRRRRIYQSLARAHVGVTVTAASKS
jgi:hypothetical protein